MHSCRTENHEKIREKLQNNKEYNMQVEYISNVFSLLGDCSRMKILLALAEGELCVYHICEITGKKQSAVSQHLKKLKDNNIVKCQKMGNEVLYSLKDEHVLSLIKTALIHKSCVD